MVNFYRFSLGGPPLNIVFLVLVIISITGVAINESFGPIIAIISSSLSILGIIIIIRIFNFDAFYFILPLILDFLIIIAAILMLSFRTSSPMKYPQIGLQQQRRYCTKCGALIEGNFCPVCGKDLKR